MLKFLIILSIVFLLSAIFSVVYDEKVAEISSEIHKYSIIALSIALSAVCVCGIIEIGTPQAIDVYRGRTTLEITYKDSIPVDSVVVFK